MGVIDRNIEYNSNRARRFSDDALPLFSTKRESYDKLVEDGRLYDRQQKIIKYLEGVGKATDQEMADALHVPVNCITGPRRELELAPLNLIEKCGKKWNPATHRNVNLYQIIS